MMSGSLGITFIVSSKYMFKLYLYIDLLIYMVSRGIENPKQTTLAPDWEAAAMTGSKMWLLQTNI
jgi:hypothetical protein